MKFILSTLFVLFAASGVNATQIEIKQENNVSAESFHSYNFGTVWVNSRSAIRYSVTNTGTSPLNFRDAAMLGSFAFSARHSCSAGLLPNQACDFIIEYAPVFEGFNSGRFELRFLEDQIIVDLWGEARRF